MRISRVEIWGITENVSEGVVIIHVGLSGMVLATSGSFDSVLEKSADGLQAFYRATLTTGKIEDDDMTGAGRGDQTGNAEGRVRPQFERIAVLTVDAAIDHMDRS